MKYRVNSITGFHYHLDVEADSEQEAIDKAAEANINDWTFDFEDDEVDIGSAYPLKEKK